MVSFYFLPTIVGIALGTVFITFLSKALKHPSGTVLNAFLLNIGWVAIFWIASFALPDVPFSIVLIVLAQFFLIKAIYPGDYFGTFLFLLIGTIFPNVFSWVIVPRLVEMLGYAIY